MGRKGSPAVPSVQAEEESVHGEEEWRPRDCLWVEDVLLDGTVQEVVQKVHQRHKVIQLERSLLLVHLYVVQNAENDILLTAYFNQ